MWARRDLNNIETCSLRCARLVSFKSLRLRFAPLTKVFAAQEYGPEGI
jgi:hypothetical protein